MIRKILKTVMGSSDEDRQAELRRNLIRREAQIGGTLFGPIPENGRREFFCLDSRTWVWHEEWTDEKTGQHHVKTTRYDLRPDAILKAQDGLQYQQVTDEEAEHLYQAANLYYQRIHHDLYNFV